MMLIAVLTFVSLAQITGAQNITEPEYCLSDSLAACPCFQSECANDAEIRFSCIKTCGSCEEVKEHYRQSKPDISRRKKRSSSFSNLKLMTRIMARQKRDIETEEGGVCKDQLKLGCDCWKNIGYCTNESIFVVLFMNKYCQKTCNFC